MSAAAVSRGALSDELVYDPLHVFPPAIGPILGAGHFLRPAVEIGFPAPRISVFRRLPAAGFGVLVSVRHDPRSSSLVPIFETTARSGGNTRTQGGKAMDGPGGGFGRGGAVG